MDNNLYKEALRASLKPKFGRKKFLESREVQRYPDSAEREFKRITDAYMKIVNQELKTRLPEMMALYKEARRTDSRMDGVWDIEPKIRLIIQDVFASVEKRIAAYKLEDRIAEVGKMSRETAIREWKRVVQKSLGLNLLADYYRGNQYEQLLQRWISDNTLRIKSIPNETLGEIRRIILDGYKNGETIRDLQREIQDEYNTSKNRARLIARDQIATLNSEITKQQQMDAGVEEYIWVDSGDSRVRDCHRELNGHKFRWDDPPEMWYDTKTRGRVYTGRKCNPGEDIACRCTARAVFKFESLNLPVSGE